MPSFKESLQGIISDAKLEHAIAFSQTPLVDLLNKHKTNYLKLHTLEGTDSMRYNLFPILESISEWIVNGCLLSGMHSDMLPLDMQRLLDFEPWKEKGSMGGLCEILCDLVISNDCLRNSAAFSALFNIQKKEHTVDEQKKILDIISSNASLFRGERRSTEISFHKYFGHYHNDYVSGEDHKHIMTKNAITGKCEINNEVLNKSLDKVKCGYYATLYFTQPNDPGHAMLIRRNNDIKKSFSFFDPNSIALFDITKEEVSNTVIKDLELNYSPININFHDIGIIERKKGISENLSTNKTSVAKSAKREVRTLLNDSNVSMLTYKQLEKH